MGVLTNLSDDSQPFRLVPSHSLYFPWPYRDPGNTFVRTLHGQKLTMGSVPISTDREGRDEREPGVLYGKHGRIAMAWLVTQALYHNTEDIEIPHQAETFRKMGLATGGTNIASITDQIRRITSMYLRLTSPVGTTRKEGLAHLVFNERLFVSSFDLSLTWGSGHTQQYQTTHFRFSKDYFSYLKQNAFPVPADLFQRLKPIHQDLLVFFSLHSFKTKSKETNEYSIADLASQFGYSKKNMTHFREELYNLNVILIDAFGLNRFEIRVDNQAIRFVSGPGLIEHKRSLYVAN